MSYGTRRIAKVRRVRPGGPPAAPRVESLGWPPDPGVSRSRDRKALGTGRTEPVHVREDGLQGRQVRVHVGEDREVHPAADRRGGLYDVLNTRRGGGGNSNNGTPRARTSACGHSPRSAPHGSRRNSSTET